MSGACRPAGLKPTPNFVVRELVDSLTVCCRFGVREGAESGEWEPAPCEGQDAATVCPRVLRLDAAGAHEASCDFSLAPCVYASCGALLRPSQVAAHDVEAAAAHASGERAARLAAHARAEDLQQRLEKLAPHAVTAIEDLMESDCTDILEDINSVAELISLHASSAAVASKGCSALARFTDWLTEDGDFSSLAPLARGSCIDVLVAALRTHGIRAPEIAETACEALANAALCQAAARKAVEQGVVAALLAALIANEHNPSMQQAGMRLLASLVPIDDDDNDEAPSTADVAVRRAVEEGGVLARVFAALRAHLAYEAVQFWAVKALCGMLLLDAASAESTVALLETGLAAHPGNSELLRLGFLLLRRCMTVANVRAEAAVALAGVVVSALHAAPAEVRLQGSGVFALEALCANGHAVAVLAAGAGDVPAAVAAGAAADAAVGAAGAASGAAAVTAAAMGAHPEWLELQQSGFCVLTTLATLNIDGSRAVGQAHCLVRILAVMKAAVVDADTQVLGTLALHCIISATDDNPSAIVAAGALDVLAAALSTFGVADETLAETTLLIFEVVDPALIAAAVPAVLAAMAAHMACAALQRAGCTVLLRVASMTQCSEPAAPPAARAVVEARVAAVVAALRAHGEANAALAALALEALKSMADANSVVFSKVDAATFAVNAGGVDAVLRALRAHPALMDVQRFGCLALCHLCDGCAKARAGAKDAGAAALVDAALVAFPDSAVVMHAKAAQRMLQR